MRKLAWVTVIFTYFLMVWGNLVSSTGSGLACPDWPLCHGTIAPPPHPDIILEWGHRLLAFTASCLILATVIGVFRHARQKRLLKRSARTLIAVLVIQILLGGTTVLLGLSMWVSTIHLLVAHVVLAGLLTVAAVLTWGESVVATSQPRMKHYTVSGIVALFIQLGMGALVRHGHAGLACPKFPLCLSGFLPIPFTFESGIAFAHRWWGILLLGLFAHLPMGAKKSAPKLMRLSLAVALLGLLQVLLGIATVQMGLGTVIRACHAAVGYALFGSLFLLALRSGGFRALWSDKR